MAGINGALARKLDFGDLVLADRGCRGGLRLAAGKRRLAGPDKYKVLEHRRRQAQIKARRLLELID